MLRSGSKTAPLPRVEAFNPAGLFRREFLRAFITFALVLLMSGGAIGGLFLISRSEATGLSALRGERIWISQSFEALSQLNANQWKAADLMASLQEGLPTLLEVPTKVIPRIQEIGKESGIRVSTQFGNPTDRVGKEPAYVGISIRADGSLSNLISFVRTLERQKMVFRLETVELYPLGTEGTAYQVSLGGKLYVRE